MDMLASERLAPSFEENLPNGSAAAAVRSVAARLIEYEHGRAVALPVHTTIEVLDQAALVQVPGAAYYCSGLTRWQGNWLPVLDLAALINAYRKSYAQPTRHLLVVAFQAAPGEALQYGALALPSLPVTVTVSDATRCALPGDSDLWPLISLACFEHAGNAVPVLCTARLFAAHHG